jgi:hypothetical protein
MAKHMYHAPTLEHKIQLNTIEVKGVFLYDIIYIISGVSERLMNPQFVL